MRVRVDRYKKIIPSRYNTVTQAVLYVRKDDSMGMMTNSLAHTKWFCRYHIVFCPKYRRKVVYNQYRESLRDIIRVLCKYKGVEIIEGHLMSDHVQMLVSIPPKYRVALWNI